MKLPALTFATTQVPEETKIRLPIRARRFQDQDEAPRMGFNFAPDFLKSFGIFFPNASRSYVVDREIVSNSSTSTESKRSSQPSTSSYLVKTEAFALNPATVSQLQSFGLTLDEIQALYTQADQYYDEEISSGSFKGYRVFVTHLGENQRPTATQIKNNITEDGCYDSFLRYPNIGFSFMVRVDGVDYLFNQAYRKVTGLDVRMCYLVKLTSKTNADGSIEVRRTLVSDSEIQQRVMQHAVDNGVLQKALSRVVEIDELINGETNAQAYADLTVQGGSLYGFSGTVSGSMSQFDVRDIVTPDGFAIRLTNYRHSTGVSFTKRLADDPKEYQDYIATNYAAYVVDASNRSSF